MAILAKSSGQSGPQAPPPKAVVFVYFFLVLWYCYLRIKSKKAPRVILLNHMQTKTILVAVLAIMSVSLAGVLGYQKLTQPETNQPVATTSNETAGWKVYNVVYDTADGGFEMKYPKDWNFYKPSNLFALDVIATFSKKQYEDYIKEESYVGKPEEENYGIVTISLMGSSLGTLERSFTFTEKAVEGLKKSGVYHIENYNSNALERNDLSGYRVYYSGKSYYVYMDGGTPKIPSFGIESVDVIYLISDKNQESNRVFKLEGIFRGKNAKEYSEVFDQMLSTFKFIK